MDPHTKSIIARINLLNRVQTEHEPVVFHSYQTGEAYDRDGKLRSKSYAFRRNDRLLFIAATSEAARHELEETYRSIDVTEDMPSYIVIEVLDARMRAMGDVAWCRKIRLFGGPNVNLKWLREQHMVQVRNRTGEIDQQLREALILEHGYDEAQDYAANREAEENEAAARARAEAEEKARPRVNLSTRIRVN